MKSWSNTISHLLLVYYCVFGMNIINRFVFERKLSAFGMGLLMVGVFLSAYPIFGWKKESPWAFVGRWSFEKWVMAGVGAGLLTICAAAISSLVVYYFSA